MHERGATPAHQLPETMGSGLAWLDYDNDGWMDLYVVQSGPFPPSGSPRAQDRLYRNNGDGTFTDVTEKAELSDTAYGMGVDRRRLRQRRVHGPLRDELRRQHPVPQQRRRHFHGRHGEGGSRRLGMVDERRLRGLRRGRATSISSSCATSTIRSRRISSAATSAKGTARVLPPDALSSGLQPALPQQRRRHVHGRLGILRSGAHAPARASASSWRTSTTTAARTSTWRATRR